MIDSEDESYVCLDCVPDKHLREALSKRAKEIACKYCKKTSRGVRTEDLVEQMRKPLECCLTVGGYPLRISEDDWDQEGESLEFILQEEFGIDYELATDISQLLIENDPAWPPHGEEPFFRSEENYIRYDNYDSGKYFAMWESFAKRLKHERRFFDPRCGMLLSEILGAAKSVTASELPVRCLGCSADGEIIYRARRADSDADVSNYCHNASKELGPPPPSKASDGRMNPRGISVFYGALSSHVAVSEVRPSVGSRVVVGEFKPTRALKVLDLPKFGECLKQLPDSVFAPGYHDQVARQRFLNVFHSLIVKPIQPGHEALEYVPTQAVAEYVVNVLGFDGILYASAQHRAVGVAVNASSCNVAIFDGRRTDIGSLPNENLKLVPDSVRVVRVSGIKYTIDEESVPEREDDSENDFDAF